MASSVQMAQQRGMLETSQARDSLPSTKSSGAHRINTNSRFRPTSVHTEFMETDWEIEDDEEASEFEEDERIFGGNSRRASVNSSGQPSMTTLSSHDEIHTPRSSRMPHVFTFDFDAKPVEGPRGPHLFRSSISSAHSSEFQNALSLSPVLPQDPHVRDHQLPLTMSITPLPPTTRERRRSGPFHFTDAELDTAELAAWHPEMIAQWMLNAGVELSVAERFVENDINGAILATLKFEDLKELGIASFGVRTRVWGEIAGMRKIRPATPDPETPIEDEPDRAVRRELRGDKPRRRPSRTKVHPKIHDVISPLESVSIVGIEQMMPKPHHCSKGESCSKWRKNQRLMEQFKKEHPYVDMAGGGIIVIAGDPGNPATAEALRTTSDDVFRPVSDALPSVVASSDVMGPGNVPTMQYLEESTLRSLQARDPQDNVRQFLDFQHQHGSATTSGVPPTPPFEVQPREVQQAQLQLSLPKPTSHQRLQALPKLSIPTHMPVGPRWQPTSAQAVPSRYREDSSPAEEAPHVHGAADADDGGDTTPTGPVYRFGTPFSDMDVPVTAVPLGPVARDTSQSVPPDMAYRPPLLRPASRATGRRPSFPVMPALDENAIVGPALRRGPSRGSSRAAALRPLQAPPRFQYPWTQAARPIVEQPIAPMPGALTELKANATLPAGGVLPSHDHHNGILHQHTGAPSSVGKTSSSFLSFTSRPKPPRSSSSSSSSSSSGPPISYAGLMRKRKTKMLRHEWAEHYFQLRGTRLTMHPRDSGTGGGNRTLEYIDIDDYAIACSSAASGSKLNAAFKAMHIRRGSDEAARRGNVAAFSFQLIPQDGRGAARLRKRESLVLAETLAGGARGANVPVPEGTPNGTGKTHHFAVGGRDERIDWMRELMLAKAKKQKGEGFEVSVNGNMI